jgi:hypothetical protein
MDEGELKRSFARNRRLADRFGKLIVVGLSLDIVFLLIFAENKSWKEILAGIFATAVIAVGVWFEIHFGGKAEDDALNLQQISDQKIAEADARAAEANQKAEEARLELARLRTPRRELLRDKRSLIAEALKPFANVSFDAGIGPNDKDVEDFLWDLEEFVLWPAGWRQIDWKYRDGSLGAPRGDSRRPLVGHAAASNVSIQIHRGQEAAFRPAADTLVAALKRTGFDAQIDGLNVNNANVHAMHILIGPRR